MQEHKLEVFIRQNFSTPLQSRSNTALSNLTNQQLSSSPSSHYQTGKHSSPQRQDNIKSIDESPSLKSQIPPQAKSLILEQENLQLKTQVEMLQKALLEIMQKDSIDNEIVPLLQKTFQQKEKKDQQKENSLPTETIYKQAKNSLSGQQSQSPIQKKRQQKADKSPLLKTNINENLLYNYYSNSKTLANGQNSMSLNYSPSPINSTTQRRKRSDRQQQIQAHQFQQCQESPSPLKRHFEQFQSQMNLQVNQDYEKTSPSFREDLPLQINCRRLKQSTDITQETLVLDKSSADMSGSARTNNIQQEKIETVNQDSMVMCSNADALMSQEDNDKCHDQSQIQIKYAQMLEELDEESQDSQEEEDELQKYLSPRVIINPEINTFDKIDSQRSNKLDEIMTQTQQSSNFDEKKYYESQLDNLKSELQHFQIEEQKLLSQIVTEPEIKTDDDLNEMLQNKEAYMISFQPQTDDQNYPMTPEQLNYHNVDERQSTAMKNDSCLMKNLREAFLELQEVLDTQRDEELIRPVRILSPQSNLNPMLTEDIISQMATARQTYKNFAIEENEQQYCDMISPLRYPNTFIIQSPEQHSEQIQTNDNRKDSAEEIQSASNGTSNSHKKNLSLNQSQNTFQSKRHQSAVKLNQQKNLQDHYNFKSMTKSPQNFSAQSLSQVRQSNQRQITNNQKQQQNSAQKKIKSIHNRSVNNRNAKSRTNLLGLTQSVKPNDSVNFETIELLAKRSSLVDPKGLQQQIEPSDDEDCYDYPQSAKNLNSFESVQSSLRLRLQEVPINKEIDEVKMLPTEGSYNSSSDSSEKLHCLQSHLSCKQLILSQSNFFGVYSLEHSEMLKQQRSQSIQRAEEMLGVFKKEKMEQKEQQFYKDLDNVQVYEMSFQEKDKKDKIQSPQKTNQNIRESTRDSIQSHQYDLINIELSPQKVMMGTLDCLQETSAFKNNDCDQQQYEETYDKQCYNQTINSQNTNNFPCNNYQDSHDYLMMSDSLYPVSGGVKVYEVNDDDSPCKQKQKQQSILRSSSIVALSNPRIISNRRISVGNNNSTINSSNNQSFNQTQSITQSKKRLTIIKRSQEPHNQTTIINKSDNNCQSNFQSFQSTSCDKNLRKSINNKNLLSKTIEQSVQEPTILSKSPYQNKQDPEYLYQHRTQSVIKKREEIQRQKVENVRNKIEAKNNKYQVFKQQNSSTRNTNPSTTNIQFINKSGCKSSAEFNRTKIITQKPQQSYSNNYDSKDHTPIRSSKVDTNLQKCLYQSNDNGQISRKNSESSNNNINDKRTSLSKIDNQGLSINPTFKTAFVNLQTPSQSTKSSAFIPSTTQSNTSKMTSECSSFRKRQSDAYDYHKNQQHSYNNLPKSLNSSGATCSLIQKNKSSNLKNSIVNRTVRMMVQQKAPKEYVQLKEKRQKIPSLHSTIDSHLQSQSSTQTLDKQCLPPTTLLNSQSFINPVNLSSGQSSIQSSLLSRVQNQLLSSGRDNKTLGSSRSMNKLSSSCQSQKSNNNYKSVTKLQPVGVVSDFINTQDNDKNQTSNPDHTRYMSRISIPPPPENCQNCLRLISKGLSTEFCLDHLGTPRCIDD